MVMNAILGTTPQVNIRWQCGRSCLCCAKHSYCNPTIRSVPRSLPEPGAVSPYDGSSFLHLSMGGREHLLIADVVYFGTCSQIRA